MDLDISHLLDGWDYEPGQIAVRKFKGKGGVEKVQLRLDLGLLQMNLVGRPDGKQPFGHETLLDYHESRLEQFKAKHQDSDEGFLLTAEEASRLQQEAIQFHHRYICLFQLQEYEGVIRDAERNLEAYDFLQQYAPSPETTWPLQHLVPQLLMLRARAKGMLEVSAGDHQAAIQEVEEGIEILHEFYQGHSKPEMVTESGEVQSLQSFLNDLQTNRPLSEKEKLERDLAEAVKREDYERAAEVRDLLRHLS